MKEGYKECVIKPSNEGSSIGVSVVNGQDLSACAQAMEAAFFIRRIEKTAWQALSAAEKKHYIEQLIDLRTGIGLPLSIEGKIYTDKKALEDVLYAFEADTLVLEGLYREESVLLEEKLQGREFSCIVLEDEAGVARMLPPTEIFSTQKWYDYRDKYLSGARRKQTPMSLSQSAFEELEKACLALYSLLGCRVYARIDGFYTLKKRFILNDPNTTSGMLPSSFFFHQGAEIGLSPSGLLTHLVYRSLVARKEEAKRPSRAHFLLKKLQEGLQRKKEEKKKQQRIAILTGGGSAERHIAIESARNVYEKLSSSTQYAPMAYFLRPDAAAYYPLPLAWLLKDNADDIRLRYEKFSPPPYFSALRKRFLSLRKQYGEEAPPLMESISYEALAKQFDAVFIAMHGRPGEDGTIQAELERVGLAFNGSDAPTSALAMDKYKTGRFLAQKGLRVPPQYLVSGAQWVDEEENTYAAIVQALGDYPFIAKPVDEGCSAGVKRIKDAKALKKYLRAAFSQSEVSHILVESCVVKGKARSLMEITCGVLAHEGGRRYEVLPASEVVVKEEILSLEEKFLAGEGQNITPARYSTSKTAQKRIKEAVEKDILFVAKSLRIKGYARVDAFVRIGEDGSVEVWIIEVNTLPGMTPATCLFHQAACVGYTPYLLIKHILQQSKWHNNGAEKG